MVDYLFSLFSFSSSTDMCLTHTRDDLLNDIPETSIAVERSHCLNCFSCKQPISQSSNDNIEHSLVYLDGKLK